MTSSRVRVAVLYGGRSAEHEVSVVSARGVIQALDAARYEVVPIAITKDGRWMLPERGPAELGPSDGSFPAVAEAGTEVTLVRRPSGVGLVTPAGAADGSRTVDVVFPVLHGPYGEDGTVQGMLELAGVPYVGAGVAASALGMDKEFQKILFGSRGIPVVKFEVVREPVADVVSAAKVAATEVGLPCFTKPANLGSSVGIRKCRSVEEVKDGIIEALRHDRKALVEEAISGRELECAVLGNDEPEAAVVGEIVPVNEFYDYEAKYVRAGSTLIVPADLPTEVADEVRALSLEAFRAIDCAGMARVDFFFDESAGRIVLNEINTIPGFTPISMYPRLWEASGVSYPELVDRLIMLALERHSA